MNRATLLKILTGAALTLLMLVGGWQVLVSAQDAEKGNDENFRRRKSIEGVWRN